MTRASPMSLAKLNVALAVFNLAMGLWLCVMAAQNYQNAQANLRNAQRNLELARGLRDRDTRRMAETAKQGSVRSTGSAVPQAIAQNKAVNND